MQVPLKHIANVLNLRACFRRGLYQKKKKRGVRKSKLEWLVIPTKLQRSFTSETLKEIYKDLCYRWNLFFLILVICFCYFLTGASEDTSKSEFEYIFSIPFIVWNIEPRVLITTSSKTPVYTSLHINGISLEPINNTIDRYNYADIRLPKNVLLKKGEQSKTIIIRSSDLVRVYVKDNERRAGDGFVAYPSSSLGTRHVIASYAPFNLKDDNYRSFFSVSAPFSNTTVRFQTTVGRSRLLQQYESYRFDGERGEDLSGTLIESDKPVALISGIQTRIPGGICCEDGLLEQLPSSKNWGKNFAFGSFQSLTSGFSFRVYTMNSSTSIKLTEPNATTLSYNQEKHFFEGVVTDGTVVEISTDKPVMVAQYMQGSDLDMDKRGDPSMLIVPPYEAYTFPVLELYETHDYYINVMIECNRASGLLLDGIPITTINSHDILSGPNQLICCVRNAISTGLHSVSHGSNVNFFVSVYAIGSINLPAPPSSYIYAGSPYNVVTLGEYNTRDTVHTRDWWRFGWSISNV